MQNSVNSMGSWRMRQWKQAHLAVVRFSSVLVVENLKRFVNRYSLLLYFRARIPNSGDGGTIQIDW